MWRGRSVRPLTSEDMHLLNRIDVRRHDTGRALLLVHGFSSSPAIFRALIPSLVFYDAILCPVLPGHGESVDALKASTAAMWQQTTKEAYQALAENYEVIDVMGISLGGILAYELSKQVSINHLYLLAPAFILTGPTFLQLIGAKILRGLGVKGLKNYGGNLYTNTYQELTYRQLPLPAIIEILTLVHRFKFTPPTCPTDVFLGRFDEVVRSPAIARLFEQDPQTTLHWLNQSAHILTLDGDIEEIINCVKKENQF